MPRRRPKPLSHEEAMQMLQRGRVKRTPLSRIPPIILRKTCGDLQLTIGSSGKRGHPVKVDFVDALFAYSNPRARPIQAPSQGDIDIDMSHRDEDIEMLGHDDDVEMSKPPVEDVEMSKVDEGIQMPCPTRQPLCVRLYDHIKAWRHVFQIDVLPEANGDLNLDAIDRRLTLEGMSNVSGKRTLRVIDPKNRRPLYQYQPGILLADDVEVALENNSLRVIYMH